MKVILDECLPRRLVTELSGHLVTTVPQAGWAGMSNGRLLAMIAGQFDAFVTVDKNLPAQQNTAALAFGVVVLRASSNKFEDLKPLVPELLAALASLQPGQVIVVPGPQG